ncbi:hypothetical protein CYMTET_19784, partial [Cymbomonas tetramitiformis]
QLGKSSKRYASILEKIIFLLILFLFLGIQQGGSVGDSQVQDALKDAVEPRMTEHALEQIFTGIEYQVQTIWTSTICGDGVCTVPFEFPSYGRYEKDQYFGHGAQTPKAITTIDVPKESTESTWYVRLPGDYYGIVSGAVYDSADPAALVPIPLEPPFEWCTDASDEGHSAPSTSHGLLQAPSTPPPKPHPSYPACLHSPSIMPPAILPSSSISPPPALSPTPPSPPPPGP